MLINMQDNTNICLNFTTSGDPINLKLKSTNKSTYKQLLFKCRISINCLEIFLVCFIIIFIMFHIKKEVVRQMYVYECYVSKFN